MRSNSPHHAITLLSKKRYEVWKKTEHFSSEFDAQSKQCYFILHFSSFSFYVAVSSLLLLATKIAATKNAAAANNAPTIGVTNIKPLFAPGT